MWNLPSYHRSALQMWLLALFAASAVGRAEEIALLQLATSPSQVPCSPLATASQVHLGGRGANTCQSQSASEADCLEAVQSVLPDGVSQTSKDLLTGTWGWVPPGCSTQSGNGWAAIYNHNANGNNNGEYTPVCMGDFHLGVVRVALPGATKCQSQSASEAECFQAVESVLPDGVIPARKHLLTGSWGWVPPGCSTESGSDWAAHYNHNATGGNIGRYQLVCTVG